MIPETLYCFQTTVVSVDRPDFLTTVRPVVMEYLQNSKKEQCNLDEMYPVRMTESMHFDERISNFSEYVAVTAAQILEEQGYNMHGLATYFESMWCQEHHKHSLMEQHVHPGVQIVGFYFIDVPEKSSVATFYDPRPGKVQNSLIETNQSEITFASNAFHFDPKPGMLLFTNSWLPHSLTRNSSNEPFRFIHFNIGVTKNDEMHEVEIV